MIYFDFIVNSSNSDVVLAYSVLKVANEMNAILYEMDFYLSFLDIYVTFISYFLIVKLSKYFYLTIYCIIFWVNQEVYAPSKLHVLYSLNFACGFSFVSNYFVK